MKLIGPDGGDGLRQFLASIGSHQTHPLLEIARLIAMINATMPSMRLEFFSRSGLTGAMTDLQGLAVK